MPQIDRHDYRPKVQDKYSYSAVYGRLWTMINYAASDADAEEFRSELEKALAAGFPIDWPGTNDFTPLQVSIIFPGAVRAGLPQVLIDAGADVNVQINAGHTPLGHACEKYICYDEPEYLAVIDELLAAGARPELDESWRNDWADPDERARRDRLEAYIAAWFERRAAAGVSPIFDYAL